MCRTSVNFLSASLRYGQHVLREQDTRWMAPLLHFNSLFHLNGDLLRPTWGATTTPHVIFIPWSLHNIRCILIMSFQFNWYTRLGHKQQQWLTDQISEQAPRYSAYYPQGSCFRRSTRLLWPVLQVAVDLSFNRRHVVTHLVSGIRDKSRIKLSTDAISSKSYSQSKSHSAIHRD